MSNKEFADMVVEDVKKYGEKDKEGNLYINSPISGREKIGKTKKKGTRPKEVLNSLQKKFDKGELKEAKNLLDTIKFDRKDYTDKERKQIAEIYLWKEHLDNKLLKVNNKKKNEKEWIETPGKDRKISGFARDLGKIMKQKNVLFFRPDIGEVVDINEVKKPDGQKLEKGFRSLTNNPSRFVSLIEDHIRPFKWYSENYDKERHEKSITIQTSTQVLHSPQFQEELPVIERIFNYQLPIIYKGELTFPKTGYDKRFGSWLPKDAPKIENTEMSLKEAKKIIYYIYHEFCFKKHKDFLNAFSNLLTPFVKGLFPSFNTRTPLFVYLANRERSGKDYCAGVVGILFEGKSIEEPPISTGDKYGPSNEELRKKIMSSHLQGRKRYHSSNNKGRIDSSVLEATITNSVYSDRILGQNKSVDINNEIDYSLSGNIGVQLSPDLANRSKIIELFLEVEDANKRKFENPTLHNWIYENRGKILSALYSLVKNWYDKGMPKGSEKFSSFPVWAEVIGGIMEAAGFENPNKSDENDMIVSLERETEEMKQFFEIGYEKLGERWIKKKDMVNMLINLNNDDNPFSYLNFDNRSDQTQFGLKINKFVGRFLSNIKLKVKDESVRASRREYKFTKETKEETQKQIFGKEFEGILEEKDGNLGNHGNLLHTPAIKNISKNLRASRENVAIDTKVTKFKIIKDISGFALPQEIKDSQNPNELIYDEKYADLFKTLEEGGYIIQLGEFEQ